MSDFPDISMSIGEYYKMLVDGKRPTRQRTHKEEPVKAPIPQQKIVKPKKPIRKEEEEKKEQHVSIDSDDASPGPDKI